MNNKRYGKILGALLGFAIGDAMGATVEFMTDDQIKEKYGRITNIIGGGWLNLKAGEVTDDTQMMLCVIRAIKKVGNKGIMRFMTELINNFVEWYESGPKDIGGACAKALWIAKVTGQFTAGYDESAQGNGSLMRALPLALLGDHDMNIMQGMVTHNSHACREYIERYSKAVHDLLNGVSNKDIDEKHYRLEPTGWVGAAFENAFYYLQNAETFRAGMTAAVNDGGDADTIAAITGGLLGVKFGVECIPKEWIEKLDESVKAELIDFARCVENVYENKM